MSVTRISKRTALALPCLGLVLLFGSLTVWAGVPEDERILVTDPAVLEQMGFGPDATVYLWTKGSFVGELADLVGEPRSPAPFGEEVSAKVASATGFEVEYAVTGQQFQEDPGFTRNSMGLPSQLICHVSSEVSFASAQLQLGNGAKLWYVDIWGVDTCAEDMTVYVLERCLPFFDAGSEVTTTLGSISSSGTPGNFRLEIFPFPPDANIDNLGCTYHVRVRLDDSAIGCSCGSSLVLQKVRVGTFMATTGHVAVIGPRLP